MTEIELKTIIKELKNNVKVYDNKQKELNTDEIFDMVINCGVKIDKLFHSGGDLEYYDGSWWEFEKEESNPFGDTIFLGNFIDSKGEKWDIGFQDGKYKKIGLLVYSNEAPCYLNTYFKDLEEARKQIARDNDLDYYEAYEEMINRAEAKGLIK